MKAEPMMDGHARFLSDLAASGRKCFAADEMDGVLDAQRAMLDATCAVDPLDELHEQTLTLDARPIPDVLPTRLSIVALRLQWMRAGYAMALADSGPTPTDEAMRARWATEYAERATRRIPA